MRLFNIMLFILCLNVIMSLWVNLGIFSDVRSFDTSGFTGEGGWAYRINQSAEESQISTGEGLVDFLAMVGMAINAFNQFIDILYDATLGLPTTIANMFPGYSHGTSWGSMIESIAWLITLPIWFLMVLAIVQYARGINVER